MKESFFFPIRKIFRKEFIPPVLANTALLYNNLGYFPHNSSVFKSTNHVTSDDQIGRVHTGASISKSIFHEKLRQFFTVNMHYYISKIVKVEIVIEIYLIKVSHEVFS